jgi:hypothetical protein
MISFQAITVRRQKNISTTHAEALLEKARAALNAVEQRFAAEQLKAAAAMAESSEESLPVDLKAVRNAESAVEAARALIHVREQVLSDCRERDARAAERATQEAVEAAYALANSIAAEIEGPIRKLAGLVNQYAAIAPSTLPEHVKLVGHARARDAALLYGTEALRNAIERRLFELTAGKWVPKHLTHLSAGVSDAPTFHDNLERERVWQMGAIKAARQYPDDSTSEAA